MARCAVRAKPRPHAVGKSSRTDPDARIDVRLCENQLQGILDMLDERKQLAEWRRAMTIERQNRKSKAPTNTFVPRLR